MTTTEIAAEHGVSRQSIHAYRRNGAFPQPVEGQGSTRVRFRADEVAAFFAANPKQPGKRTDLATEPDQGEPEMSAPARRGLTDKGYEDRELLLGASNVIERRWPGEYPTLVRDLRDLGDTIEEADDSDG
jgi:predicted DNA-binding transcriptional regulator AlpA